MVCALLTGIAHATVTVAVLFFDEDEDGNVTKHWEIGNIEEVAVVKGTFDERRALADNGSNYLLGLDKDYMPKGVHIDDPNGGVHLALV